MGARGGRLLYVPLNVPGRQANGGKEQVGRSGGRIGHPSGHKRPGKDASRGPPKGRLGLGLTLRRELCGSDVTGSSALPGQPSCSLRAPFLYLENAVGGRVTSRGLPGPPGLRSSSCGMGGSSCPASAHSSQGRIPSLRLCPMARCPELGLCGEVCRQHSGCG